MPDASPTGPVDSPTASRSHLIMARVLAVVAVLLTVISVYANFAKREALDPSHFRDTSRTVAFAMSVRDATEQAARRLLEEPRVQNAFVTASMAAHRQLIALLNDDFSLLQTSGGKVVLDVRPLVIGLGERFSLAPDLEARIPPNAAQITILESSRLKTAQRITRVLKFTADWIWIFALAAAVAAVWLARGRRRIEVRALGIGLVISGFLVLIIRTIAGRYLVDELASSPSARPATATVYSILTAALRGAGWTGILIGVVALAGIWLSGPRARAVSTRRVLAPYMKRPEITYGTLVLLYLLLLWWRPTPQFGFARTVIVWFALAVVGTEVLRRQTIREFPDAEPTDIMEVVRGWFRWRPRSAHSGGNIDELERVAQLHSSGAIDDAEFAAWKARLLGTGPAKEEGADASPADPAPSAPPHADD